MECFCGAQEVVFPESMQVEKVNNCSAQHHSSSIPIPQVTSELLERALDAFDLDARSLEQETFLSLKQSKQLVPMLS